MKLKFSKENIKVEFLSNDKVKTVETFYTTINNSIVLIIPKDFIFNGASIPRFMWRFIGHPYQSKFIIPSLVHDFCYTRKCTTKNFADKVFYHALLYYKVSKWRAWCMWKAVSWFGGNAYKN